MATVGVKGLIFTARCTLVQSAVLRSHVVCLSVRLSVCLSVTLVNSDHIGWNSSNIISPLVSMGCSLFATPTWRVCSKGNTPKFGPKVTHPPIDLSVGDIRSQIAAEWLHIAQRSQWRAYRKPPSLFLMVSAISGSNKFKMASAAILEKFQMAISPQQLTIYLYSAHRAVIFAIAQLSCWFIIS